MYQAGKLKVDKERENGFLFSFMDFLTTEGQTSYTLAQFRNEILTAVSPVAKSYSIIMWINFHSELFRVFKCFTRRPLCVTVYQKVF